MGRWLVMLLVALTALAGLGAARLHPAEPEGPVRLALPPADGQELRPTQLAVRPDGEAFAAWHLSEGTGLAVWQVGDDNAVLLTGAALGELAWSPDGVFFAGFDAPVGGRPQILHYSWGEAAPKVVVEGAVIRGKPRALAWRSPGWLYFADDQGLKAAQPGTPWRVVRLPGPAIPDTLQYGSFAPGSLRYIGLQGGSLVLAEAGQEGGVPLAENWGAGLTRVAWSQDGSRVALGMGHAELGGKVLLMELPRRGAPRLAAELEGGAPLFVGDRLVFLDQKGRVLAWQNGEVAVVAEGPAVSLGGGLARGPLYVVRRSPEPMVMRLPLQ